MPDSQLEEARRCPKCEVSGIFMHKKQAANAPRGTMVELYECRNDNRCPEYIPQQVAVNGSRMAAIRYRWYIQINPDGTIPPKGTGSTGPKAFEPEPDSTMLAQRARDNLALMAARDERQGNNEAYEIANDLNYRGSY